MPAVLNRVSHKGIAGILKGKLSRLKPYLRWFIVGLTLFFLLATLRNHWQEVAQIRLDRRGWLLVGASILVTTSSHIWSALVWGRILTLFRVPLGYGEAIALYLRTNMAKYLPGNIWHFYGRMTRIVAVGSPWGVASLAVLLEPLLLAAAAAIAMVLGLGLSLAQLEQLPLLKLLVPLGLIGVLGGIHPYFFNPVIQKVSRGKTQDHDPVQLNIYPWQPLLGELVFIGLRGTGFLLTWWAIAPLSASQIPQLLGVFSGAWLAGFIIPGAPGGLGVFEVVALALLETVGNTNVGVGSLLTIVALMRGVSILAEILPLGIWGWRSPVQKLPPKL
ncbi:MULTISPECIES: hypothetical protein [Cyanophyceae]|uniref:hypothetical protein n=1 Tax=Cyanophyceae TaxID=3028117 RepID=UPI00016DCA83|nr:MULTISPECIES: hypothetical protein [Cyanophyceae]ACB00229.1 conserved hypothetical membrane protein [Picosynechococcus sp. PCC 7002]SMH52905.1 hypothetical protein SAMN06272755_2555 [Picosynechococcus sp. OG1]SMQ82471.1 hypothetical protein SAMN06272774_1830 [Synechococcus sp. 7002]